MWKVLLELRENAKKHIEYKIGNGKKTAVWYDKWNDIGPLCQRVSRRDVYEARFVNNATVADIIVNGQWAWKDIWAVKFPDIANINVPNITDNDDEVVWRSKSGDIKKFSIKQVWDDYREQDADVN